MRRSIQRIALVAAVPAVVVLLTNIACAASYPAYSDINSYFASLGETVVSPVVIKTNTLTAGTDANGGWILKTTSWQTTDGGPIAVKVISTGQVNAIGAGGISFSGYIDSSSPVHFASSTTNLITNPPLPTPPKATTAQRELYTANVGIFTALSLGAGALGNFQLSAALGAVAAAFAIAAADPVDLNYTLIATPTPSLVLTPPTLPSETPAQIFAGNDLVAQLADLTSQLGAMATSFDRSQGAYISNAPGIWAQLQFTAFNAYSDAALFDADRINADGAILGLQAPVSIIPVSAVPEPTGLALMGAATVLMSFFRNRRRLNPFDGLAAATC